MGDVILRILVSDPSEFKFLVMNGIESSNLVDRVIVVEHNFTHSGKPLEWSFRGREKELFEATGNNNIEVYSIPLDNFILKDAITSEDMHENENLIRKSFLTTCDIKDEDFIIAIDADEIIYRRTYYWLRILKFFVPSKVQCFSLQLHQFFYKMNYLWTDNTFRSSVALSGKVARSNPGKLRDSGRLIPIWAGCHFSWQLSIPQMITKLNSYAHSPEYRHLANPEVLEAAIREKTYPFDPERDFSLKILDQKEFVKLAPKSWSNASSYFPPDALGSE